MQYMIFKITSSTSKVIIELADNLKSLSSGDLRHVASKNNLRNEIGLIPIYINSTKDNLGKIFRTIMESTKQLTIESSLLESISRHASDHAENQASSLEEAAAALEEYSASIEGIYSDSLEQQQLTKITNDSIKNLFLISSEVDSMSDKSKSLADLIINDVNRSSKSFEQAISSITEASHNTKQISDILEIIKDISDQVNLLSLNASIEAARAGDSGKGFAVVASEVGKLANKTAHSTKTISELIQKVSVSTELSVHSVSTANSNFISLAKNLSAIVKSIEQIHSVNKNQIGEVSEIQTQAGQIVDRSNSVLTATGEQKRVNIEMGTTVSHLTNETTKLSQMSEKTAHTSHKLNILIQDLHKDLSQFIL
jgi:methyl-accepting chemotaxis protein